MKYTAGRRTGYGGVSRERPGAGNESTCAWESRKSSGIPTFPQLRRRRSYASNRADRVLIKADISTC